MKNSMFNNKGKLTLSLGLQNKSKESQTIRLFSSCYELNNNVALDIHNKDINYEYLLKACLTEPFQVDNFKISVSEKDEKQFLQTIILLMRKSDGATSTKSILPIYYLKPTDKKYDINIKNTGFLIDGILNFIEWYLLPDSTISLVLECSKKFIKPEKDSGIIPLLIENKSNKAKNIKLFDAVNESLNKSLSLQPFFENITNKELLYQLMSKPFIFKGLTIYSKNNPAQINETIWCKHPVTHKILGKWVLSQTRTPKTKLKFIDNFKFNHIASVHSYLETKILPKTKAIYIFKIKEKEPETKLTVKHATNIRKSPSIVS